MKRFRIILLVICIAAAAAMIAPAVCFADGNPSDDGESMTVYVTITNDSDFVTGSDGTVMARVPVTLKYFDLADYGLDKYYRLDDYDEVIKQPTVLHLLIRVCEKYYARRKMTADDVHSNIINVTGAPKSVWLDRFWGHDGNLMYFVNNMYPLMSDKWGATCDYILLEDGDEIEMALYTDWTFYNNSAFMFFEDFRPYAYIGQNITMRLMANPTSVVNDGVYRGSKIMAGEPIRVSSDRGRTWTTLAEKSGEDGTVSLTFDSPGIYYVATGPKHVNYKDAAPAVAVIAVSDPAGDPIDVERENALYSAGRLIKSSEKYVEKKDKYTPETYSVFSDALAALNTAVENSSTTAADIEAAISDLEDAIYGLVTLEEEAARILAEAKSAAKTALEQYKAASDYRDAEKELLASIIAEGGAAIDSAASTDAVETVLANYKGKIDELKTAAEYEKEEQAAEEAARQEAARKLAEAKSSAKTELEQYKAASDYRYAEKEQLASLIAEGGAAIDDAASIDAVEAVLASYKGKIDELKTAAEYEKEEQAAEEEKRKQEEAARQEAAKKLAEAKSSAKTALEQYRSAADYRNAEKEQLTSYIADGKAAIDASEDIDSVAAVLDEYKGKISALKTDAEYTEEEEIARSEEAKKRLDEAKSSAKTELENYKAVSDYRDDEQKQLQTLVTEGKATVDSAGSVERITVILEEYKGKIDKLKTAAEYEAEEAAAEEERKKKEQEAEEERKRQEEADRAAREAAEKAAKEAAEKAARELAVKNADVLLDEAAEYEEKSSGYTEASYTAYCEAVEELKVLIGDEKASAEEIEAASEKVRIAVENLTEKNIQPMKVTGCSKKYKKSRLKKSAVSFTAVKVKQAKGTLSYKVSVTGKSKKVLKFSAKKRKVTVKKGAGKGTYKIRITVAAAGNGEFLAGKKTMIVKVRVR